MAPLPPSETDEQCELITDESLWPGVKALCAELGYGPKRLTKFEEGSLPVYDLDDELVLKLYPGADIEDLATEEPVMRALQGALPIPTPEVVATGRHDGWGYLLMTKLPGRDLRSLWPELSPEEKVSLSRRAGECLAVLHTVPPPPIGPADWDEFVAGQTKSAAARQEGRGLDPHWVRQIPGFLASVDLGRAPNVLLHTEFVDVHLLADRRSGGYELTGLLDFEPSMYGRAEYDLLGPAILIAKGDKASWRAFLEAYGYRADEAPALARRLAAYALLHRFANVPWYLRTVPAPEARTFEELAEAWFGI
ncbi:aminoglycoside phosphotransferase family protein [Glycomyces sp. NPDC048151]|uniref:aminoglycoside phosphotransferase family protein n=1 Tax=Glycomyces sp. NPDC048151 TaxID=3364002 RepID=UPI003720E964